MRVRPLLVLGLICGLAGCGFRSPTVDPSPPAPVPSAPPSAAEALFQPPKDACAVLPAAMAQQLNAGEPKRIGSNPLNCSWELDAGNKYTMRTIKVTYTSTESLASAKRVYDSTKQSDVTRGRGANITMGETAEIRQIGSQREGQQFDEGYYFYTTAVIAGLTLGDGTVVLRRGNVAVAISVSGYDVRPPYTGTLTSEPLPSNAAKDLIDKTADTWASAILPA